ncbi:MAG: arsenate reductase (glutaredoxin) [Flavobacteriaceae bacterium]
MIEIYHNPRCRKSREGLAILQESGQTFEVVEYLKDVPSADDLAEIVKKLGIEPAQLLRKNEAIWKEKYKGKELSDMDILKAMADHPKLIERPIVISGNKAVLGRPPELIAEFISK